MMVGLNNNFGQTNKMEIRNNTKTLNFKKMTVLQNQISKLYLNYQVEVANYQMGLVILVLILRMLLLDMLL